MCAMVEKVPVHPGAGSAPKAPFTQVIRFQKCLKAYNSVGFWWCSRALLEEEEEGGRGGEGGGGEGEENKEKEKEEEGQEAPYNWLPPDHPPLVAFTGIIIKIIISIV